MKMLTATSAIENKVIKPSSRVMDSAALRFGPGQVVHNWDGLGEGRLTFRDVIALSRNVGSREWPPDSAVRYRAPPRRYTRPGARWASGSRRGWTYRGRYPVAPSTPGPARGCPSTSPTVPSGRRSPPPPSAGCRLHADDQWWTACSAPLPGVHRRPTAGGCGRASGAHQEGRRPIAGHPAARHFVGLVVRQGLAHPALSSRRQDGHGADLA